MKIDSLGTIDDNTLLLLKDLIYTSPRARIPKKEITYDWFSMMTLISKWDIRFLKPFLMRVIEEDVATDKYSAKLVKYFNDAKRKGLEEIKTCLEEKILKHSKEIGRREIFGLPLEMIHSMIDYGDNWKSLDLMKNIFLYAIHFGNRKLLKSLNKKFDGKDAFKAKLMDCILKKTKFPIVEKIVCEGCQKTDGFECPLRKCSRCGTAFFCSKECFKKHWPNHKKHCVPVVFTL